MPTKSSSRSTPSRTPASDRFQPRPNRPTVVTQTEEKRKLSPLLITLILLTGLFCVLLGVVYIRRVQELRQQAAVEQSTVTLGARSRTQDNKLLIDVVLNTKTYDVAGVEMLGFLQGIPKENVTVKTDNAINLAQVNTILETHNNETRFEVRLFAPIDPSKTANTRGSEQVVTTFEIVNPPSSGVTVGFYNRTKVPVMDPPTVALQLAGQQTFYLAAIGGASPSPTPSSSPNSDSSKKSCDQNCATDTECQSALVCYKGRCRVSSDPEDSSCKAIQDNGLNRSCNQYCADTNECADGFSCYFNQCRNPRNLTSTSCEEPKKVTTTTSTSGRGGTTTAASRKPSPSPSAKIVAQVRLVSPSPSARASASASASPRATSSARPTPSSTPFGSQQPTVRNPQPSPTTTSNRGSNNSRIIIGVIASLIGIGVLGFVAYKFLIGR